MSITTNIGKTMTAKEFIESRKEMLFDKEFDELIKKQTEEKAKQQAEQEQKERFIKLIKTLSDCQDEIAILKKLYKESLINNDIDQSYKDRLKKDLTNLKVKETKTKKRLEEIINSERR